MIQAEQVVIDIIANDKASTVLSNIRKQLSDLANVQAKAAQQTANVNQNLNSTVPNQTTQALVVQNNEVGNLGKNIDDVTAKSSKFGSSTTNAVKSSYSSFHQLNNMMIVVGGTFNNLSTQIAGIFGAAGLSGLIQKMWEGAAQRQQNIMYLMHQKGVEEANKYYDEIMDIVTQLPGDDTFLTNILNMASALDSSLKLDNLKEAGTAITDYYMAATMKGENSYETQKDIRKYITTGDTRGLRNSVLASEIDLLKNKNSVLARTQALEKALDKTGFSGMSEYESALNQFEEFKGHFQKAFADLGGLVLAVTQPLMKFYNTIDTVFGSRVSQLIIVLATSLVGLFAIIGGGLVIVSSSFRMIEVITLAMEGLSFAIGVNSGERGIFNTLLMMSMSLEEREKYLKGELTIATWGETVATIKNSIARRIGITLQEEEIVTNRALLIATYELIKSKIILAVNTVKYVFALISDVIWTWRNTDAKLSEVIAEKLNTLAKKSNTVAVILNTIAKMKGLLNTLRLVGAIILATIIEWTNTQGTFANTYAHLENTIARIMETEATYGLAIAVGILDALLAPEILIILAIVGAVIALIVVIEKLGEAFGWWTDFGSMFQAIADGINRMWNAFMNSDIIQGIIQYFGDFVATIQDLLGTIYGLFADIFGWTDDGGTFDLVQSIIDVFGKLGEVIKWVWNLLDDWSNSPLGIITWLNPLGILLFHLDEIGSFLEDIRDAINIFKGSTEFQDFMTEIGEAIDELKEPFMEIWDLITEIVGLIGEIFTMEDPEGQGTEKRINFLVEILKGLAFVIKTVLVPVIKSIAFVIRVALTPLRVVLTVIKAVLGAIRGATGEIDLFGSLWNAITFPLRVVQGLLGIISNLINRVTSSMKNLLAPFRPLLSFLRSIIDAIIWANQLIFSFGTMWEVISAPIKAVEFILDGVGKMITYVSDAIKNSIIGKLLGWDKDDNEEEDKNSKVEGARTSLYDRMKNSVQSSNMNFITKNQILGELDKQKLTGGNVNDVRNLGQTYNNNNNQRQVVINQNFAQGSMPIDARNMTKKEARKMFIGAFGYRRAVGSKGILH